MKNKKNKKFTKKATSMLYENKPSGIGDFLEEDTRKAVNTEIRTNRTVRGEFRLPFNLAEELRKYAFDNRTTKTATVIKALRKFFLD